MTTVWPSASESFGPTRRARISAGPPGGTATIIRIGRAGYGDSAARPLSGAAKTHSINANDAKDTKECNMKITKK